MFLSIFFICQASACELQPFSCHDLANDIYSQTAEIVFSHLNYVTLVWGDIKRLRSENPSVLKPAEGKWKNYYYHYQISSLLSSSSSSSSSLLSPLSLSLSLSSSLSLSLLLYRQYRLERELKRLLWKIDYNDLCFEKKTTSVSSLGSNSVRGLAIGHASSGEFF